MSRTLEENAAVRPYLQRQLVLVAVPEWKGLADHITEVLLHKLHGGRELPLHLLPRGVSGIVLVPERHTIHIHHVAQTQTHTRIRTHMHARKQTHNCFTTFLPHAPLQIHHVFHRTNNMIIIQHSFITITVKSIIPLLICNNQHTFKLNNIFK